MRLIFLSELTAVGSGYITHPDQQVSGLAFRCFPDTSVGKQVVVVDGPTTAAINNWTARVGAQQITRTDALSFLGAVLASYKLRRSAELRAEIDAVQAQSVEAI